MEDFRVLLSQTPNPPPGTRRRLRCNMAATTPSQVGIPRSHSWPNVTQHIGHEKSNPIHVSFMHSLQYTAFTFLLCVLGPKANNLWHILSIGYIEKCRHIKQSLECRKETQSKAKINRSVSESDIARRSITVTLNLFHRESAA